MTTAHRNHQRRFGGRPGSIGAVPPDVYPESVAHLVRDEGVAGSNPATPTNEIMVSQITLDAAANEWPRAAGRPGAATPRAQYPKLGRGPNIASGQAPPKTKSPPREAEPLLGDFLTGEHACQPVTRRLPGSR